MKNQHFSRQPQKAHGVSRGRTITVKEENTLLPFLFLQFANQSKTSVKTMLSNRQISVNRVVTTQFDTVLQPGDVVDISHTRGKTEFHHPMLRILWEDDYLIVVEKKAGLLSMATAKEKFRTAYHLLSDYVKKSDPHNRIFILHRLDKDTSGVMMFAKDRLTQNHLQQTWNKSITQRTYVAVVEGRPEKETDLLCNFLAENTGLKVYVASQGNGQEAITRYKVLKSNDNYSLLELNLETGRKNQIRAQMESIGHPVAGDAKYGAQSNPAGRLALHARSLAFVHPVTEKEMRFESPVPSVFQAIVKKY